MARQLLVAWMAGSAVFLAGLGPPPSMTPPVRTVVFPPSYGVTSVFDVSTKTLACLARSRRDSLNPCSFSATGLDAVEESVVMEAWESNVSAEANEKPELELDERELEREWVEMVDNGETDRGGVGNLSRTGVIHVGAATSSAIMAKS